MPTYITSRAQDAETAVANQAASNGKDRDMRGAGTTDGRTDGRTRSNNERERDGASQPCSE